MSATAWKGSLNFGLLSIPVKLHAAARDEKLSMNQLHKPCGSRVKMPLTCPTCARQVPREEIVKGYEFAKGQYVTVTEDELKAIAPVSDHIMEIAETVALAEIDPIYFAESYCCVPEPAGKKPYSLLSKALRDKQLVAIAHLTRSQREITVILRPKGKGLVAHALYFANEVRQVAEFETIEEIAVSPAELKLAVKLVESLAAPWQPEQYQDGYQARLRQLFAAKQKGETVTATPEPERVPVADMMAALEASLASVPRKKVAA